MIVNKDNYQISQYTGEETVRIFKDGKEFKTVPAKKDLKYDQLVKVLELYRND